MTLYEIFPDTAYNDMWCVRPISDSNNSAGFDVVSEDEAKALRSALSFLRTREDEEAASSQGIVLDMSVPSPPA